MKNLIVASMLLLVTTNASSIERKSDAISVTTRRHFYVITANLNHFPKETKYFDVTFNGFYWHRYQATDEIWLVKVNDLANTVLVTPVDKDGIHLESNIEFKL